MHLPLYHITTLPHYHLTTSDCETEEWQCSDGNCIEEELKCDGANDCPDWSDEKGCSEYTFRGLPVVALRVVALPVMVLL